MSRHCISPGALAPDAHGKPSTFQSEVLAKLLLEFLFHTLSLRETDRLRGLSTKGFIKVPTAARLLVELLGLLEVAPLRVEHAEIGCACNSSIVSLMWRPSRKRTLILVCV